MHYHVPEAILTSLRDADDDQLVQRRAKVQEALGFIAGRSGASTFGEGMAVCDAIDREIIHRRATGKPRRQADEALGATPAAARVRS